MNNKKFCFHQYNTFVEVKKTVRANYYIQNTTKVCSKCGKRKIKEKLI